MAARGARLHSYPNCFVEGGNLLAQLSPGREHRPDDRRYVVTAGKQGLGRTARSISSGSDAH
jgi:hypothetical protein